MRASPLALFLAAASLLLGCGASDGAGSFGGEGGEGGGASTSTPTDQGGSSDGGTSTFTSSGGGGTSTATGGAGGGLPATCDAIGVCGNTGGGCVGCAVAGPCADAYSACFASDDCVKYQECVTPCAADAACEAACELQTPAGKAPYDAFAQCVLCDQCPASCGSAPICP
ncbi:MAG: hypothetical protein U0441_03310 [Polyangiaceae bacterium]